MKCSQMWCDLRILGIMIYRLGKISIKCAEGSKYLQYANLVLFIIENNGVVFYRYEKVDIYIYMSAENQKGVDTL